MFAVRLTGSSHLARDHGWSNRSRPHGWRQAAVWALCLLLVMAVPLTVQAWLANGHVTPLQALNHNQYVTWYGAHPHSSQATLPYSMQVKTLEATARLGLISPLTELHLLSSPADMVPMTWAGLGVIIAGLFHRSRPGRRVNPYDRGRIDEIFEDIPLPPPRQGWL